MPAVSIAVSAIDGGDPKAGCRWAVSRDGEEIECGVAANEDAAYEAAKPHFDRLRAEMALLTRSRAEASSAMGTTRQNSASLGSSPGQTT